MKKDNPRFLPPIGQVEANIGSVLYEKALSGAIKAVQFYLKTQAGWPEKSYIKLSKAEEPIDTQWTVTVVGAD